MQAPYDFWAEWERVYTTAKTDSYDNEYQFGFDLYEALQKTFDGHFYVYPDSVAAVFAWGRRTPLVSVSLDGACMPGVYVYHDILDTVNGSPRYTPSPLTLIKGRNSTQYLLEWAQYGGVQDRDALWNDLFYLLPQVSLGRYGSGTGTFSGGGRGGLVYPEANTTLTFANGSSSTYDNFARVLASFTNITSGPDLYKELFIPPEPPKRADQLATSPTSSTTTSTTTTFTTTVPAPGYPTPVIRHPENLNSGYFLDGEGYDDVAVLSLTSFAGGDAYRAVNTDFLERAVVGKIS